MPPAAPTPAPVEETLAYEESRGTAAGIAAILAGVLTLVGGILAGIVYQDFPRVLLVDALREAAGEDIGRPGLRTEQILFYDDKVVELLALSIALAIGGLLILIPLGYLARATRARRPEFPRAAFVALVVGPVLVAVAEILLQVVVAVRAADFADGADLGTAAAHDALRSDFVVIAQIMRQAALLALGFAFVLVSLNAMRAGLLTRFMGILGIIVGILFVVPLGGQLPVVQAFWLIALGVLLLGVWPGAGVPPAWKTGEAQPWPSQQELREARERQRGGSGKDAASPQSDRRHGSAGPSEGPTPGPAAPTPHATSKKKKRKKR